VVDAIFGPSRINGLPMFDTIVDIVIGISIFTVIDQAGQLNVKRMPNE
jgi:hypothetical protein